MENTDISKRIASLIFRNLQENLSESEQLELQEWLGRSQSNQQLYDKICDEKVINDKMNLYRKFNEDEAWNQINGKLGKKVAGSRFRLSKIIAYAAAVLLPICIVSYLFFFHNKTTENKALSILPGKPTAVLTLANGEVIDLSVEKKLDGLQDHKVNITNVDETLKYSVIAEKKPITNEIAYNTLRTPKGGEYSIELTDGTKIWLNADTKLTYPVEFNGDVRQVNIVGEAYLEVAHNELKPFVVQTPDMNITVLGTSFNVMSYINESVQATTLVEGSVKLSPVNQEKSYEEYYMKPGQQAILDKADQAISIHDVETSDYTAWKDGLFVINNETLGTIMRRLERWYNFTTHCDNPGLLNYHFSGTLDRYDHIETILEMIELTIPVHFNYSTNNVILLTAK